MTRPPATAAAARAPHRAVAKVTSGAPPTAAYGVNGEAVSAKASRPHGKPPNGTVSRASSSATHRQATHSGQPGSRSTDGVSAPASARNEASSRATSSQASGPMTVSQDSSGTKVAKPCTRPTAAALRAERPRLSRTSSATPTGARGQRS